MESKYQLLLNLKVPNTDIHPLKEAFGAAFSGRTLSGKISSDGVSRTTLTIESYSSSFRANFLQSNFSNSILSKLFAFSAA